MDGDTDLDAWDIQLDLFRTPEWPTTTLERVALGTFIWPSSLGEVSTAHAAKDTCRTTSHP